MTGFGAFLEARLIIDIGPFDDYGPPRVKKEKTKSNTRNMRMALLQEDKAKIVKDFGKNENDSGAPQVQIALLTHRIRYLTEHFKAHKHDHHSRRGLLKLVGQRRRLLNFVRKRDIEGYRKLIKQLGIRK